MLGAEGWWAGRAHSHLHGHSAWAQQCWEPFRATPCGARVRVRVALSARELLLRAAQAVRPVALCSLALLPPLLPSQVFETWYFYCNTISVT